MGPAPCQDPARWPRSPSEPLCAPSSTAPPWKCFPQGSGLSTGGSCRAPTRAPPQNTRMLQEGVQGSGGRLQPPSSAPGPCETRSRWPRGHVPGILLPRFAGEKMKFSVKFSPRRQRSQLNPRPLRPGLCSARERRAADSSQLRGAHTAAGTTGRVGLQPGKKQNKKHARKHVRNAPRGPGWSRTSRVPSG